MTLLMAVCIPCLLSVALCILGKIADEWDDMCFVVSYLVRRAWRSIGEWLFDVQTAYWKFRAHRERKNKQYF